MAGSNKIIAILGKSGAGKTLLQEFLETRHGIPRIVSYTTRPQRDKNDTSHIFVSNEEFDKLDNRLAETVYGEYKYAGIYPNGMSGVFTYVIDLSGYNDLLKKESVSKVQAVIVEMTDSKRKALVKDDVRFYRDNNVTYNIPWAIHILNNGSILDLQNESDSLVKYLKSEEWL